MSTPKLVNFPLFWIPGVGKKHVYIYISMYICQLFPTISPHFMGSSIANGISLGFHVAPGTPVDARNAMSSHQTFVLCSISAPDFCKTRDICIYIYICMSIQTLFKEDIVFRGTFKFPDLYSGICQWFQVSIFPNAPYIYIYIYSYIIYSKQFPKIIMGFNH